MEDPGISFPLSFEKMTSGMGMMVEENPGSFFSPSFEETTGETGMMVEENPGISFSPSFATSQLELASNFALPAKLESPEFLPASGNQNEPKPTPKLTKPKVKRPFGSIRCRACNRYGITNTCPCSPSAQYSVVIQSKLISKERRGEVRRVAFATVKEAENFRQMIAKECFSRSTGFYSRRAVPSAGRVLPRPDAHTMAMLQKYPFGNKRPIQSPLNFQPMSRHRAGLLPEHFLPTTNSPTRPHPLVAASRTAYAMPQQRPTSFQPFHAPPMPMDFSAPNMMNPNMMNPNMMNPAAAYNPMFFAPKPVLNTAAGARPNNKQPAFDYMMADETLLRLAMNRAALRANPHPTP